jgi:hypothetical protein
MRNRALAICPGVQHDTVLDAAGVTETVTQPGGAEGRNRL